MQLRTIRTYTIEEEVTIHNIQQFQLEITKVFEHTTSCIILNMQHVQYLNNTALVILANTIFLAKAQHKEIMLYGVTAALQDIFKILPFIKYVRIFVTLEEANRYCDEYLRAIG